MATTTEGALAQRVDTLRRAAGFTVAELARNSDIPLTTLQRRLLGDGDEFTVAELSRISQALNVTPASWFEAAA